MHECPNCGYACDCDGEDLWNDAAAGDCECPCDPDEEPIEEADEEAAAPPPRAKERP